jgi:hypothetical protein
MPQARIQWPQQNNEHDEFAEYNELIVARHPLLDGAFARLDGLSFVRPRMTWKLRMLPIMLGYPSIILAL